MHPQYMRETLHARNESNVLVANTQDTYKLNNYSAGLNYSNCLNKKYICNIFVGLLVSHGMNPLSSNESSVMCHKFRRKKKEVMYVVPQLLIANINFVFAYHRSMVPPEGASVVSSETELLQADFF